MFFCSNLWNDVPYQHRQVTGLPESRTREGMEILKQRSLEDISSQPDNTYYTDCSSDETRVAAAVVHKEEEIIIILNDSASILDTEMTAICPSREDATETRHAYNTHRLFDRCEHTKQ